jgi:hypothetical protein
MHNGSRAVDFNEGEIRIRSGKDSAAVPKWDHLERGADAGQFELPLQMSAWR